MKKNGKRFWMMLLGIALISVAVGCYRLSEFGVDAFTCMNLGISGFLGMSFGNWQLFVNIVILIVVFFTMRSGIGLGTIVNMVAVGYIADFICWIVWDQLAMTPGLLLRIIFLIIGTLFATLGVAFYIVVDMGIAPYDNVAPIIEKLTRGKLPFAKARVATDIICVIIGVGFCLIANDDLWKIVGIGTILNAFLTGPFIQFFREHITEPLLNKD